MIRQCRKCADSRIADSRVVRVLGNCLMDLVDCLVVDVVADFMVAFVAAFVADSEVIKSRVMADWIGVTG
jgi:hypothetical protein